MSMFLEFKGLFIVLTITSGLMLYFIVISAYINVVTRYSYFINILFINKEIVILHKAIPVYG